jgi:hypothetical protein
MSEVVIWKLDWFIVFLRRYILKLGNIATNIIQIDWCRWFLFILSVFIESNSKIWINFSHVLGQSKGFLMYIFNFMHGLLFLIVRVHVNLVPETDINIIVRVHWTMNINAILFRKYSLPSLWRKLYNGVLILVLL